MELVEKLGRGSRKGLKHVEGSRYVDLETGEIKEYKQILKTKDTKDEGFIKKDEFVYVKKCGQHVEVVSVNGKEVKPPDITKLNSDTYVVNSTGEVRQFNKATDRSQSKDSLRKTFKNLRDLINANFEGAANELFVTLTYRGDLQTNDHEQVYKDFKNFMKRFRTYYKDKKIEYINVVEPHASGNYHMHVLLKFIGEKKIYIPNEVNVETNESINAPLRDLWGKGNVNIRTLKNNDNIGIYLTAYLTDIEVPDDYEKDGVEIKEVEVDGKKKKFIKGGRLSFYEQGMKIFRPSRGIEKPEKEEMKYEEIKKVVRSAKPHYQQNITLENENNLTTLKYEQYNLKRQGNKYKGLKKSKKTIKYKK